MLQIHPISKRDKDGQFAKEIKEQAAYPPFSEQFLPLSSKPAVQPGTVLTGKTSQRGTGLSGPHIKGSLWVLFSPLKLLTPIFRRTSSKRTSCKNAHHLLNPDWAFS